MAFFLGLAQFCGKEREFAAQTMIFMYASLAGISLMAINVYILTPLVGLDGAASATLSGFGSYFLIVAFVARTWPRLSDVLIGALGSILLLAIYWGLANFFGYIVSRGGVPLIFSFYGLWIIRPVWNHRFREVRKYVGI
jgi:hypothetical protein